MRLFVDDTRAAPEGWELARTVTDAIRILANNQVDVISLDHDIVFQDKKGHTYGLSKETFEPIVHFIKLMPEKLRPDTVIIHTANPPAGDKMMRELKGVVKHLVRDWEFGHHPQ